MSQFKRQTNSCGCSWISTAENPIFWKDRHCDEHCMCDKPCEENKAWSRSMDET